MFWRSIISSFPVEWFSSLFWSSFKWGCPWFWDSFFITGLARYALCPNNFWNWNQFFILIFYLYSKRNMQRCKIWFYVELVLLVVWVVAVIWYTSATGGVRINDVISIIFQVYFLVVVYAFIEELKTIPENTVWEIFPIQNYIQRVTARGIKIFRRNDLVVEGAYRA